MKIAKLGSVLALLIAQSALPLGANALPVGAKCGGILPIECGTGKFCNYPSGNCGRTGKTGRCELRPRFCPMFVRPVCGCDHKQYGNDCERKRAGVSLLHNGKCK